MYRLNECSFWRELTINTKTLLQRYYSLIDHPKAFARAIAQPLPSCVWVNPLKTNPEAVAKILQSRNLQFEPLKWYENAFRVHHWQKPGSTLAFAVGWYNLQEEIALSAVKTLDPQPGEKVLDLCAAPGGKTVQIATQLQGSGMVIANEMQVSRLSPLRSLLDRMGLSNVIMTNYDGRCIPLKNHSFDRVLVDAPCSGEGTLRKSKINQHNPRYTRQIATTQQQLLHRALQLVKPGGIIVYSTCTFAPEENEAVIDAVLGDRGWLESATIPELTAMVGLRHWEGQTFRDDLRHAQRYFPHFNNTGGFFVARIRRSEKELQDSFPEKVSSQPQLIADSRPLQWFSDRFGINPELFAKFRLWYKGKDRLWLAEAACEPTAEVFVQTIGIPLLRGEDKPTTYGLQRFASKITRCAIALEDVESVQTFLQGESQPLTSAVESGYIHVRYGKYELGCGLYKQGVLRSQIPKSLRNMSLDINH